MTPRGLCEGGERSGQTAGSASGAACTWCVRQEPRGCTRSGLSEKDRVHCSKAQQGLSKPSWAQLQKIE